ncbi:hypothetical protein R1sor_002411 [Riccia sorocarpa]|uniref:Uncharacterized protein n=1 Tax=Riccia sorocarpa TaxID=122646 RepID=A0ABD3H1F1_9MARC
MSTLTSHADLPTIAPAVALQNEAKSVALDLLSGAIGVLLAQGNLTKDKKVEMAGSLSTVKDLILKEICLVGSRISCNRSPRKDINDPQDLPHDELKKHINEAISQSDTPDLKIQPVHKYKNSLGLIVASSSTRDSLLANSSWGPKAFTSFVAASAPKECFQLLAHYIPTELELDEITTNLEKDNPYLHIDTTSSPRWLLKDLTGKKRSSF